MTNEAMKAAIKTVKLHLDRFIKTDRSIGTCLFTREELEALNTRHNAGGVDTEALKKITGKCLYDAGKEAGLGRDEILLFMEGGSRTIDELTRRGLLKSQEGGCK